MPGHHLATARRKSIVEGAGRKWREMVPTDSFYLVKEISGSVATLDHQLIADPRCHYHFMNPQEFNYAVNTKLNTKNRYSFCTCSLNIPLDACPICNIELMLNEIKTNGGKGYSHIFYHCVDVSYKISPEDWFVALQKAQTIQEETGMIIKFFASVQMVHLDGVSLKSDASNDATQYKIDKKITVLAANDYVNWTDSAENVAFLFEGGHRFGDQWLAAEKFDSNEDFVTFELVIKDEKGPTYSVSYELNGVTFENHEATRTLVFPHFEFTNDKTKMASAPTDIKMKYVVVNLTQSIIHDLCAKLTFSADKSTIFNRSRIVCNGIPTSVGTSIMVLLYFEGRKNLDSFSNHFLFVDGGTKWRTRSEFLSVIWELWLEEKGVGGIQAIGNGIKTLFFSLFDFILGVLKFSAAISLMIGMLAAAPGIATTLGIGGILSVMIEKVKEAFKYQSDNEETRLYTSTRSKNPFSSLNRILNSSLDRGDHVILKTLEKYDDHYELDKIIVLNPKQAECRYCLRSYNNSVECPKCGDRIHTYCYFSHKCQAKLYVSRFSTKLKQDYGVGPLDLVVCGAQHLETVQSFRDFVRKGFTIILQNGDTPIIAKIGQPTNKIWTLGQKTLYSATILQMKGSGMGHLKGNYEMVLLSEVQANLILKKCPVHAYGLQHYEFSPFDSSECSDCMSLEHKAKKVLMPKDSAAAYPDCNLENDVNTYSERTDLYRSLGHECIPFLNSQPEHEFNCRHSDSFYVRVLPEFKIGQKRGDIILRGRVVGFGFIKIKGEMDPLIFEKNLHRFIIRIDGLVHPMANFRIQSFRTSCLIRNNGPGTRIHACRTIVDTFMGFPRNNYPDNFDIQLVDNKPVDILHFKRAEFATLEDLGNGIAKHIPFSLDIWTNVLNVENAYGPSDRESVKLIPRVVDSLQISCAVENYHWQGWYNTRKYGEDIKAIKTLKEEEISIEKPNEKEDQKIGNSPKDGEGRRKITGGVRKVENKKVESPKEHEKRTVMEEVVPKIGSVKETQPVESNGPQQVAKNGECEGKREEMVAEEKVKESVDKDLHNAKEKPSLGAEKEDFMQAFKKVPTIKHEYEAPKDITQGVESPKEEAKENTAKATSDEKSGGKQGETKGKAEYNCGNDHPWYTESNGTIPEEDMKVIGMVEKLPELNFRDTKGNEGMCLFFCFETVTGIPAKELKKICLTFKQMKLDELKDWDGELGDTNCAIVLSDFFLINILVMTKTGNGPNILVEAHRVWASPEFLVIRQSKVHWESQVIHRNDFIMSSRINFYLLRENLFPRQVCNKVSIYKEQIINHLQPFCGAGTLVLYTKNQNLISRTGTYFDKANKKIACYRYHDCIHFDEIEGMRSFIRDAKLIAPVTLVGYHEDLVHAIDSGIRVDTYIDPADRVEENLEINCPIRNLAINPHVVRLVPGPERDLVSLNDALIDMKAIYAKDFDFKVCKMKDYKDYDALLTMSEENKFNLIVRHKELWYQISNFTHVHRYFWVGPNGYCSTFGEINLPTNQLVEEFEAEFDLKNDNNSRTKRDHLLEHKGLKEEDTKKFTHGVCEF